MWPSRYLRTTHDFIPQKVLCISTVLIVTIFGVGAFVCIFESQVIFTMTSYSEMPDFIKTLLTTGVVVSSLEIKNRNFFIFW